jgi:hypothetical protein
MKLGKKERYEIELGELKIEGVKPVVEDRMITKVGRISMRGTWKGRGVKIVECANVEHALFVAGLMADGEHTRFFPEVFGVHDQFLVTGWVSGKQLTARHLIRSDALLGQLVELLDSIHCQTPRNPAGFDYVEDHIRPRFRRSCCALGLTGFLERVENSWEVLKRLADRPYVSHPDLSPANMILTTEGQVKIVDNELLNVSCAPWFDQMHIVHFIGDTSVKDARKLDRFLKPLLEMIDDGHNGRLLDMWSMRMGGAQFVAGNVKGVLDIATDAATDRMKNTAVWRTIRACYPGRSIEDLE